MVIAVGKTSTTMRLAAGFLWGWEAQGTGKACLSDTAGCGSLGKQAGLLSREFLIGYPGMKCPLPSRTTSGDPGEAGLPLVAVGRWGQAISVHTGTLEAPPAWSWVVMPLLEGLGASQGAAV